MPDAVLLAIDTRTQHYFDRSETPHDYYEVFTTGVVICSQNCIFDRSETPYVRLLDLQL